MILTFIGGILCGACAGIGFFPAFKQPKNFRIQVVLAIMFVVDLAVMLILIKLYNPI